MVLVQIIGVGCAKCAKTRKNVERVMRELGREIELSVVQDVEEVSRQGLVFPPILRINGEVKCSGRVPSVRRLKKWLSEAAETA